MRASRDGYKFRTLTRARGIPWVDVENRMGCTGGKERAAARGQLRQLMATIIVNLSVLSYGVSVGWPSPMIPRLQCDDTPLAGLPMTDEEASWLSSALCLGGIGGTLLAGFVADSFGRKMTGYAIGLLLVVSWTLTALASSPAHLYAARFFAGVGGAGSLHLVPLYVSEISLDELRGTLGSLLLLILNTGILLAYLFATILSFRLFAVCALLVPLAYIASFPFLPESPIYLLRRNRTYEATRALMWLRACRDDSVTVDAELARLQARLNESPQDCGRFGDFVRDRGTIRGLIIILGLFVGQQLCGIFAMISYTETIFEMSGSWMAPSTAAIMIAGIQTFGSYVSTAFIERTGRKRLLVLSCAGMCLCHCAIATYCLLHEKGHDVSTLSWLPVAGLSIFTIVYSLGMGPMPYIIGSEIMRADLASSALTVGLLGMWMMAFLVLKFFALVVLSIGVYGCFYLLGTFCLCNLFFALLVVPETKGRPLEYILQELKGPPVPTTPTDMSFLETLSTK